MPNRLPVPRNAEAPGVFAPLATLAAVVEVREEDVVSRVDVDASVDVDVDSCDALSVEKTSET